MKRMPRGPFAPAPPVALAPLVAAVVVVALAAASLSCSRPPAPRLQDPGSSSALADSVLLRAVELWSSGHPEAAGRSLRDLGRAHYSYYRMDEVLYWLGRARASARDFARAQRCLDLLRRHYPRCSARFADLDSLRGAIDSRAGSAAADDPRETASPARSGQATAPRDAPGSGGPAAGDAGPLVSNVFYETDIRQALMDISAQTGVSIISDALVRGYVTAEFQNLPLESCLDRLLTPLGLAYRRMDGYYLVGAPIAESPSYPLFTMTKAVALRHRTAVEVMRSLPPYYQSYARADAESNVLAVTAPPGIVAAFERDVAALDRPAPQVMIEALIVEMNSEARRAVGLDWDWSGTRDNAVFSVSRILPALADSALIGRILKPGRRHKDMRYDLRGALRVLAAAGRAEVRANPRGTTPFHPHRQGGLLLARPRQCQLPLRYAGEDRHGHLAADHALRRRHGRGPAQGGGRGERRRRRGDERPARDQRPLGGEPGESAQRTDVRHRRAGLRAPVEDEERHPAALRHPAARRLALQSHDDGEGRRRGRDPGHAAHPHRPGALRRPLGRAGLSGPLKPFGPPKSLRRR